MPAKVQPRPVRYANALRSIFLCPNCKLETSYTEHEISADGVCCRSCKRWFVPVVFHKDYLCCSLCRHRLTEIHYREADDIYALCAECAEAFDRAFAVYQMIREQFFRQLMKAMKHHRRRPPPPPAIEFAPDTKQVWRLAGKIDKLLSARVQ